MTFGFLDLWFARQRQQEQSLSMWRLQLSDCIRGVEHGCLANIVYGKVSGGTPQRRELVYSLAYGT